MRVKYNRVSTQIQTGFRFEADRDKYDLTLLDKISGTVPFKDRPQAKILINQIESGTVKEVIVEEGFLQSKFYKAFTTNPRK